MPDKDQYSGTAIVTYGRSLMAVVIAHSLSSRGVRVISCDDVSMTAAAFSKFTRGNFVHAKVEADPEQYISDLRENILKYKPESGPYVLIPTFRDASFIAENSDRFSDIITVAAPNFDAINQVSPKQNLLRTLNKNPGISAPKTWYPKDTAALEKALKEIKMPALLKAVDEVGGRGIEFFKEIEPFTSRAQKRFEIENPPPLLQQAVTGQDFCLGVYCLDGEIVAQMAYHNLETQPGEGGAGAMRETIDEAPFLESAQKLMRAVNWNGIAEIDFMWTGNPEDSPNLIEVNTRFWAGLFQSVESGVDFPWIVYHHAAYGSLPEIEPAKLGTKTRIPGLWMAGAVSKSLKENIDMEDIRRSFSEMSQDLKSGQVSEAFQNFKTAFSKLTDFDDVIAYLKKQRSHARQAKSELLLSEDPMTSLGVFFVLSSMLRHGELPPEIKS